MHKKIQLKTCEIECTYVHHAVRFFGCLAGTLCAGKFRRTVEIDGVEHAIVVQTLNALEIRGKRFDRPIKRVQPRLQGPSTEIVTWQSRPTVTPPLLELLQKEGKRVEDIQRPTI